MKEQISKTLKSTILSRSFQMSFRSLVRSVWLEKKNFVFFKIEFYLFINIVKMYEKKMARTLKEH